MPLITLFLFIYVFVIKKLEDLVNLKRFNDPNNLFAERINWNIFKNKSISQNI